MTKKDKMSCLAEAGKNSSCCKVESLISVDERGQMVLPKETRIKAGIRAGDKLALVGWCKGDRLCCLSLIKAEEMTEMVGELVSSLMVAPATSAK